jgi:hypothetical protein
VLLLSVFMIFWCSEALQAGAREAITVDFDATTVGELPAGFSTAVSGGGGKAAWRVAEDVGAPSCGKVLAQTSTDKTSSRFPLCI